MDLTHIVFLHPGFGGEHFSPKVSGSEESDGSILAEFVTERMPNTLGTAELPGEFVRSHDRMRWIAPSTHLLEGRIVSLDVPGETWMNNSAHILTPETPHSTHYFWSSALKSTSTLSDEDHMALLRQTFNNEDKPMVEAVQRRMGGKDLWELNPVLLKNDAGGARVRRRTAALIKAETQQAASSAPPEAPDTDNTASAETALKSITALDAG